MVRKDTVSVSNVDPGVSTEGTDRRHFLVGTAGFVSATLLPTRPKVNAVSSATPAATGPPAPAVMGGTPTRAKMLRAKNPGPQYYDEEERRELLDVLESRSPFRWNSFESHHLPEKCINFEREFARHLGTKYCVAVTSGTTALITALAGLGVGPGDEVILPAWTWYACYDAILFHGALPVFAEIDESLNIDPNDIERRVTPKTKVIMPVHLQGEPADIDAVLDIARRHNLRVLEDCAQCVGGSHRGRRVGSIGDVGIYSFQVSKTITAGEGGAVVTSDPLVFERAVRFHDVGILRDPGHAQVLGQPPRLKQIASGQFRMNEFTGAVMRAQLRKLDRILDDQRDKLARATAAIRDLPGIRLRKKNTPDGGTGSRLLILTASRELRDRFVAAMRAENVWAGPPSGSALLPITPYIEQKQGLEEGWPSFSTPQGQAIQYGPACCPRTLDLWSRYVEVSMDPKFTDQDLADIVAAIRKVHTAVIARA